MRWRLIRLYFSCSLVELSIVVARRGPPNDLCLLALRQTCHAVMYVAYDQLRRVLEWLRLQLGLRVRRSHLLGRQTFLWRESLRG